jgi:tetratricopeptide (TPR) repeat protein
MEFSIELFPLGESILQELNIDSGNLKSKNINSHQRAHYRAIINWLTKYHPQLRASNLEQIKGFLESFYLLCQIENWKPAKKILGLHVNPLIDNELHEYLHIWGHYQEQISMYESLLGKYSLDLDSVIFNGLGITYHSLGKYQKAIECYKKDLEICQMIGNLEEQVASLGDLALAYHFLGNYDVANEYHEKCLDLINDISDSKKKGAVLGNMGLTCFKQGKSDLALDYQQKYLEIATEANDMSGQIAALGNLGNVFSSLGENSKALDCYQKHLEIAVQLGDRRGEGAALHNLSSFYRKQHDYKQALNCILKSVLIFDALNLSTQKSLNQIQKIKELMEFEGFQIIMNQQLQIFSVEIGSSAVNHLLKRLNINDFEDF